MTKMTYIEYYQHHYIKNIFGMLKILKMRQNYFKYVVK